GLAHAASGGAGVADRAGVAVVAGGSVGRGRVGARAGHEVARARRVALVLGPAHRRRPGAGSRLTRVAGGANVAVRARGAVGDRQGIRTYARGRIAAGDRVALVGSGTHRAGATAHPGLARVAARAGIAVVARGAVGDRWVRAGASRGIAGPGCMALVPRGAHHRRPGASPRATAVAGGAPVGVGTRGAVGDERVRAGTGH